MSKKRVRIKDNYPDYSGDNMLGAEAVILHENGIDTLIGFPLDSALGWYDRGENTEYRCWWISQEYLEPISIITRSKFK